MLIRLSQRRKYVYQAKTCPGKAETFFIERKRHKQRRKSVSRAKTHIKERIRVYISEKALTGRKIVYRANTFLAKAKPNENVPRKGGNAFYREKTTKAKAKKRLPRENVAYKGGSSFTELICSSQSLKHFYRAKTKTRNRVDRANTRFPSENVFSELGKHVFIRKTRRSNRRKCIYRAKNALTERKRKTQMPKRFNRAKSSTANVKMRFPSGNVAQ